VTSVPLDLDILTRRLNGPAAAPVAVAVSGGGDSLALLQAAKAWADQAGRRLLALTVDHQLRPEGADWARFVAERAARLGVAHRTLVWEGAKPTTGLQAAARRARHALIADAARAVGAGVVLLGHTADDVAEAQAMRDAGASTPSPREWAPSPAWPEGRGVFLLRPLLGVRRQALRDWLAAQGERWIEDPANDDARFARTRARRARAAGGPPPLAAGPRPCIDLSGLVQGLGGDLRLPRRAFAGAGAGRLLSALCLCASGAVRPPRGPEVERLLARLAGSGQAVASLAGARIEARGEEVTACREAGEFRRSGLAPQAVPLGVSVFDGRFEVTADTPGWRVRPLAGIAAQLSAAERDRLARLPAAVRRGLPAAIREGLTPTCPLVADGGPIRVRPLAGQRFLAALGAIADEASLWRVAKRQGTP